MKNITPQQAAQKWVDRLSAATNAIRDGVNNVKRAPGEMAAEHRDLYLQGVTANVGKWARNVAAVSLADWKRLTIDKGLPRVAPGAAAAKDKFTRFMTDWLNFQQQVVQPALQSQPRGTIDQNIQRAVTVMRLAHEFGGKANR